MLLICRHIILLELYQQDQCGRDDGCTCLVRSVMLLTAYSRQKSFVTKCFLTALTKWINQINRLLFYCHRQKMHMVRRSFVLILTVNILKQIEMDELSQFHSEIYFCLTVQFYYYTNSILRSQVTIYIVPGINRRNRLELLSYLYCSQLSQNLYKFLYQSGNHLSIKTGWFKHLTYLLHCDYLYIV